MAAKLEYVIGVIVIVTTWELFKLAINFAIGG